MFNLKAQRPDLGGRALPGDGGLRRQGIAGRRPKDLRGALDEAMNFRSPALVNVVISQVSARKAQEVSPGILSSEHQGPRQSSARP